MSELFNSHERNQIAKAMSDMDRAYNQHNTVELEIYKKGLFGYITDLVVRKITEQQIEEVLERMLKKKGANNE